MSKVKFLLAKYNRPKDKFKGGKIRFDPNNKWVEYSLDLLEARRLLQTVDFTTKFQVLSVVNKIESKVKFHQNHKDFDLRTATIELQKAKKLLRL